MTIFFSSANLQLGSGIRQVGLRVGSDDTIRTNLDNKSWTIAQAKSAIDELKTPEHPALSIEELMVWTALDCMQTIAKEAADLHDAGATTKTVGHFARHTCKATRRANHY